MAGGLFWKTTVLRLDLMESSQLFFRTGRGRSSHVDGPKTEKAREPTVESLVGGLWRLRVSEAERRVRPMPTEPFAAKLCMVMRKPEFHVKRLDCHLQGQGPGEF